MVGPAAAPGAAPDAKTIAFPLLVDGILLTCIKIWALCVGFDLRNDLRGRWKAPIPIYADMLTFEDVHLPSG